MKRAHETGAARRAAKLAFWSSAGALVYAQAGYPLLLAALARVRAHGRLVGQPGPTMLAGQPARDRLAGQPNEGVLADQPGCRVLAGQPGTSLLADQPNVNVLAGQPGPDLPAGQPGADLPAGQPGADLPAGQAETDLAAVEPGSEPLVSLIVAAHREADVIAGKVANARALDWPAGQLEVIVACDGSPDDTPARARAAGADRVLELRWGGKVRAQDAAVRVARGQLLAFSDANARWEPNALRALAARFADPRVGYVCGQVRFVSAGGTNQEGLYWRYEMAIRALESRLSSITAGNGAIYAVRREAYVEVDPVMGHDLKLPFTLVKDGWRAVYEPAARASEKMVPTIEGEFARKRRMMSHMWPIVLRGGMLDLRGYPPLYALMIASHRVLRYFGPFLHVVALLASAVLATRPGRLHRAAFASQLALLAAAAAGGRVRARPLLVARYYVLTTASIAAGLADHLWYGTPAGWAPPEGTR